MYIRKVSIDECGGDLDVHTEDIETTCLFEATVWEDIKQWFCNPDNSAAHKFLQLETLKDFAAVVHTYDKDFEYRVWVEEETVVFVMEESRVIYTRIS